MLAKICPEYRGRWMVLVDAAKGSATDPPDLARYPADFVVFSFYKVYATLKLYWIYISFY